MRLRNLIDQINYVELVNIENFDIEIFNVSYNSKKAQEKDIFICLSGEHVDGHEYAQEAVSNGAEVLVVEKRLMIDVPQIVVNSTSAIIGQISSIIYNEPSTKLNVIGVTGTNGKTTVTHLIQKL